MRKGAVRRAAAPSVAIGIVAVCVSVALASPSGSTLPLTARVLHAGDFLGLRPRGRVVVIRKPEQWVILEPPPAPFTPGLLEEDGFAGGISEHLYWPGRKIEGLSVVVQLGSHAAATKYLTIYNGFASPFPVSGIPRARGFGNSGGINVVFVDGDYAYLVGAGWQPGVKPPVTRQQLITAAKLLYRRVHGH